MGSSTSQQRVSSRLSGNDANSANAQGRRVDQEASRVSSEDRDENYEELTRLLTAPNAVIPEFASKQQLSKFIPELDPDHKRAKTWRILAAPTREEIDRAHAKNLSLELGVPSIKNLRYIKRTRFGLWLFIGLWSTILHLIWNSAIFASFPVVSIPRAIVTNDFLSAGDNWTTSDPLSHYGWWMDSHYESWETLSRVTYQEDLRDKSPIYSLQSAAAGMAKIDPKACAKRNVNPRNATSPVIIVTRNNLSTHANISSLLDGWASGWQAWPNSNKWICETQHDPKNRTCDSLTIGDAINSFLSVPGNTEYTSSLLKPTKLPNNFATFQKRNWETVPRVRWFKAIDPLHRFAGSLGFAIHLLVKGAHDVGIDLNRPSVWKQGFEAFPDVIEMGHGSDQSLGFFAKSIFRANRLQLMGSLLYLLLNNILTRLLVTREILGYTREHGKKPLRVSSPVGMQRSSYFLSLPWKYSGPLMLIMTTFHWAISQCTFVYQTSTFGPGRDKTRLPNLDFTATGYSLAAGLFAIILAFIIVSATLIYSALGRWVDVPRGFHRLCFNSSAISLLCQRPSEDRDAHLFPLRLGVVGDKDPSDSFHTPRLVFSTDTTIDRSPPAGSPFWGPGFEKMD
ncbi:hypothetical protein PG995_010535 [Apiospora arundinis]